MRPRHTGVYFYVPQDFDPRPIRELDGLHNEAAWLINKVACGLHKYRHDGEDGVRLSRQTMKQFIHPSRVSAVRRALLDAGVLACDESYTPASMAEDGRGESMRYWIGEKYLGQPLRRVECTSQPLARKVRLHRYVINHVHKTAEELADLERHMLSWLRRLRIDADRACQIIDELEVRPNPPKKRKRKRKKFTTRKRKRKARTKLAAAQVELMRAQFTRAANKMAVSRIVNDGADYEFERCRYGRVHTVVTRLLSEVRSCLSIDGQPLVSVDIRNSQVFFFALVLLSSFESEMSSSQPGVTSSAGPLFDWSSRSSGARSQSTFPFVPRPITHRGTKQKKEEQSQKAQDNVGSNTDKYDLMGLPADVTRFVKATVDGTVYDILMRDIGVTDRKQFKQWFFQAVLYGRTTADGHCSPEIVRLRKAFRTRFPTVWEFVVWMKRDGHEKLAHAMQARESKIVIDSVCGHLQRHHAGVPLISIHDSLLTTPQHLDTVVRVLRNQFEALGVVPALHVEHIPEPALVAA